MKISTKGRYGLTLMISLAKREGQGCVSLKTIAEENKLSDLYLEQLGDIIRLLEGPITFVESIDSEPPAQKQLWIRMRDAVRDVLDHTTLKYLADYKDTNEDLEGYMFYI
ncbi:MAG: Rrf2 family transcriptional regulator [Staphylococcus epidermidis]|nr:Rrf2 family transcriptional regulator [Staphylococcus epidermidis]